jgi:hypothetical protein
VAVAVVLRCRFSGESLSYTTTVLVEVTCSNKQERLLVALLNMEREDVSEAPWCVCVCVCVCHDSTRDDDEDPSVHRQSCHRSSWLARSIQAMRKQRTCRYRNGSTLNTHAHLKVNTRQRNYEVLRKYKKHPTGRVDSTLSWNPSIQPSKYCCKELKSNRERKEQNRKEKRQQQNQENQSSTTLFTSLPLLDLCLTVINTCNPQG